MRRSTPSTRGWIGPYLLLAVLWGCSFLFIAMALQTFAPTQVAFGRIVIGFALLAVILLIRRERVRVERRRIGDFVMVGAIMTAIPFVLFALAEQRVTSVLAGLVNATTPLFTAVFVALLLPSERPDRVQVGGLRAGLRRHRRAARRLERRRDRPGRRPDAAGRHVLLRPRQRVEPSSADQHRACRTSPCRPSSWPSARS